MERPGVELATSRSQVRPPNLYITEPPTTDRPGRCDRVPLAYGLQTPASQGPSLCLVEIKYLFLIQGIILFGGGDDCPEIKVATTRRSVWTYVFPLSVLFLWFPEVFNPCS